MVRAERQALLAGLLILLSFSVTGLEFDVTVSDLVGHNSVELDYNEEVETVQTVNTTVENTGSIGCEYRLRLDMDTEEGDFIAWSSGESIWPGESRLMEVRHAPTNFTGEVNASLDLLYCDQVEELENFSFQVDENSSKGDRIESDTLEVNSSSATADIDNEDGVLVPVEAPSRWKVSSSQIEDGEAAVEYEPTLFNRQRELEYLILDDDMEIRGSTVVDLSEEPPLTYRIRENSTSVLVGFSVLLNLILVSVLLKARRSE